MEARNFMSFLNSFLTFGSSSDAKGQSLPFLFDLINNDFSSGGSQRRTHCSQRGVIRDSVEARAANGF